MFVGGLFCLIGDVYYYFINVMCGKMGDKVVLFNGVDGEWEGVFEL